LWFYYTLDIEIYIYVKADTTKAAAARAAVNDSNNIIIICLVCGVAAWVVNGRGEIEVEGKL